MRELRDSDMFMTYVNIDLQKHQHIEWESDLFPRCADILRRQLIAVWNVVLLKDAVKGGGGVSSDAMHRIALMRVPTPRRKKAGGRGFEQPRPSSLYPHTHHSLSVSLPVCSPAESIQRVFPACV